MVKVQKREQICEEAGKDTQLSTSITRHSPISAARGIKVWGKARSGEQSRADLEQGICQVVLWKYRKELEN